MCVGGGGGGGGGEQSQNDCMHQQSFIVIADTVATEVHSTCNLSLTNN